MWGLGSGGLRFRSRAWERGGTWRFRIVMVENHTENDMETWRLFIWLHILRMCKDEGRGNGSPAIRLMEYNNHVRL